MSTCNQLDLQTLGSQPIMPKNILNHYATLPTLQTCMVIGPAREVSHVEASHVQERQFENKVWWSPSQGKRLSALTCI